MPEKKTPAQTFWIRWQCDVCTGGEMLPTGHTLLTNPPQHKHKCSNCGAEALASLTYPQVRFEEIKEDAEVSS